VELPRVAEVSAFWPSVEGVNGSDLGPTLKDVGDYYFHEVIEVRYSPSSISGFKSALNRHVYPAIADIPIRQLRRQDLRGMFNAIATKAHNHFPNRIGCPGRANTIYWFLHRFFEWCIDEKILDANPTQGMGAPAVSHERERFLSDDEIRWFWWTTGQERFPYGAIARLLLLTGQRRSEIANIEKAQIDREARMLSIPILKTKARRSHLVPLSDLALEVLDSVPWIPHRPLIFSFDGTTPISKPGLFHANKRFNVRMKEFSRAEAVRCGRNPADATIPLFSWHDLRRTAATVMCRLGQPIEAVDRIMNHAGGRSGTGRTLNSVTRIYVRHEFLDERRAALQALANHVRTLVGV
jgi:integrase